MDTDAQGFCLISGFHLVFIRKLAMLVLYGPVLFAFLFILCSYPQLMRGINNHVIALATKLEKELLEIVFVANTITTNNFPIRSNDKSY